MNEKKTAEILESRWISVLERGDPSELTLFLSENSNLPGPRANLTLAIKLGELFTKSWARYSTFLRRCIDSWGDDEYLRTCRNIVIGYIVAYHSEEDIWTLDLLYQDNLSNEWRPREAVTIGLTKALQQKETYMLQLLHRWNEDNDLMILRNTLVTLADPENLRRSPKIREALRLYTVKAMMDLKDEIRTSMPSYKMLKKSLGFTISVAAVEDPQMIRMFEAWVESDAKQWKSVLKSNLNKNRLAKKYPELTARLKAKLSA